jgi:hypothetical protein
MSSSVEKSSATPSPTISQNIVYGGIAWAVISLLFFLLFSITAPGQESPLWYLIGTYILELLPFLAATVLCFRNWRSPTIASGRNVWLGIGLGMAFFFLGGLIFGWWELYWQIDPDVSPADFFYLLCYLFIGWGMVLAVLPRRLNLETKQWLIVAAIALVGTAFATWVLVSTPEASSKKANNTTLPSATEQAAPEVGSSQVTTSPTAPLLQNSSSTEKTTANSEEGNKNPPPSWVMSMQETLSPLSKPVNFFYIIGDVILLIIASTLLLAFWGGRFAQSWRMLAGATLCLYIADMWFKYADTVAVVYQSGSLPEVFFVFSGVLFAIGAALEYDVSSRSRRSTRKRA